MMNFFHFFRKLILISFFLQIIFCNLPFELIKTKKINGLNDNSYVYSYINNNNIILFQKINDNEFCLQRYDFNYENYVLAFIQNVTLNYYFESFGVNYMLDFIFFGLTQKMELYAFYNYDNNGILLDVNVTVFDTHDTTLCYVKWKYDEQKKYQAIICNYAPNEQTSSDAFQYLLPGTDVIQTIKVFKGYFAYVMKVSGKEYYEIKLLSVDGDQIFQYATSDIDMTHAQCEIAMDHKTAVYSLICWSKSMGNILIFHQRPQNEETIVQRLVLYDVFTTIYLPDPNVIYIYSKGFSSMKLYVFNYDDNIFTFTGNTLTSFNIVGMNVNADILLLVKSLEIEHNLLNLSVYKYIGCKKGEFIVENSKNCSKCPIGYSSHGFSNRCIKCTADSISVSEGGICETCEPGEIANEDGTVCIRCPQNTIRTDNKKECTKCTSGYIANTLRTECILCPVGFEVSDGKCVLCKEGMVRVLEPWCVYCEVGYTSSINRTTCFKCPAGTYEFERRCITCPAGTISSESALICTKCISGSFPNKNRDSCVICEENSIVSDEQCYDCGFFFKSSQNRLECVLKFDIFVFSSIFVLGIMFLIQFFWRKYFETKNDTNSNYLNE
eukprot:TRINITY_DN2413_c0_g1_i1.p1 TRINITY_DN2413_c0_g1~~TRINITY_DN2413_c0_g1_i1.p1  ORF type:complete len:610 (+),score=102.19 TRINITY_DN2413_c0_g1_i1:78-1907(+)